MSRLALVVMCVFGTFVSAKASGQLVNPTLKFSADPPEQSLLFGRSISGQREFLFVGGGERKQADGDGTVFILDVSDPGSPLPVTEIPSPSSLNSFYGWAVAADGNLLAVGAPVLPDGRPGERVSGVVYIYSVADPADPQLLSTLGPADRSEDSFFGGSIAIDGSRQLVGAEGQIENGRRNIGTAYLFDLSNPAEPVQVARLRPDDETDDGRFGTSVAMKNGLAVVGAPLEGASGATFLISAAYLFDASDGAALDKIVPEGLPGPGGRAGMQVATDGSLVLIDGEVLRDGVEDRTVYVYEAATMQELSRLFPAEGVEGRAFGRGLTLEGSIAIASDSDADVGTVQQGAAFVYDLTVPSAPRTLATLVPTDFDRDGFFGRSSLALGDSIFVVSPSDDQFGSSSGAVYRYPLEDCDASGSLDFVDIADGIVVDSDSNGVIDDCETCSIADISGPFGSINFFDISTYLALYNAGDEAADLAVPFGSLNFFDVSAYLSLYSAGCP